MKKLFRFLKDKIKKLRDRLESKSVNGKTSVGSSCYWTLVLNDISDNSIVLSGGAGNDISFEIELIQKTGCKVFLFDPSPTGINTIRNLRNIPSKLKFISKGLGGSSGKKSFSFPKNEKEGSFTIRKDDLGDLIEFQVTSVSDFCKHEGIKVIDCLKLDIEGFEYEVLEDILANSDLVIHQILVEFHHFFKEIPYKRTLKAMERLKKAGYEKIHRNELDYSFQLQK